MEQEVIQNENLNFQPKAENYSFSANRQKKKINTKWLLLIIGTILLFIFLCTTLLFLLNLKLNLFNNNSQKSTNIAFIYPSFPNEQQYKAEKDNYYIIIGTLEAYNEQSATIRVDEKSVVNVIYNSDTDFYISKTIRKNIDISTPSAKTVKTKILPEILPVDFPTDILKPENIGEKVNITYQKEEDKNILLDLTLIKYLQL